MEENVIPLPTLNKKKSSKWWLWVLLTPVVIFVITVASATFVCYRYVQQAITEVKNAEYPVMYCPRTFKYLLIKPKDGFRYPLLPREETDIIWGNGRFRLSRNEIVVADPDNLPIEVREPRNFGFDFEKPFRIKASQLIFSNAGQVTGGVYRIRYTKGILYCMGKDACVAVDIKNETWRVFVDPTQAPPPYKEELAKLKQCDKDNIVWTDQAVKPYFRWIPEPPGFVSDTTVMDWMATPHYQGSN